MADIRQVLQAIDPSHTLDDLTLSAHHWVLQRKKDSVPLLDGGRWRDRFEAGDWDRFHEEWRDRLDGYDAFICFHPPIFAYLYRAFNKPIICQFSIRYEYPAHHRPEAWRQFNDYLRAGVDHGLIALCANSPYDSAYGELFVGRPVPFVPSLCEYTGATWQPRRDHVVYYAAARIAELDEPAFMYKKSALPPGHAWADVAQFTAIAHFPYNVSTMSIAEQYAMGVPLFFPSLDYAVTLYERGARLFEQSSWNATERLPPGSAIVPAGGFPDGHDPNDYTNIESLRYWLQYADYYDDSAMPGVTYFSSLDELQALARQPASFYKDASRRIRARFDQRRQRALDGWRRMIASIS